MEIYKSKILRYTLAGLTSLCMVASFGALYIIWRTPWHSGLEIAYGIIMTILGPFILVFGGRNIHFLIKGIENINPKEKRSS